MEYDDNNSKWGLKKGSIIYYNGSYGRLLHAVPINNNDTNQGVSNITSFIVLLIPIRPPLIFQLFYILKF